MESSQSGVVSALVFDLDGTLIDSTDGIKNALKAAFAAAGVDFPEIDLRTLIGPPIRVIARRVNPELTEEQLAVIERVYRREYDTAGWQATVLFEDAENVLRSLSDKGLKIFVVTNKPLLPARQILSMFGLAGLFDSVVTRDSREPHYSTKSEMVAGLIEAHGLRTDSTVLVGDTPEDAEAADKNGLRFLFAAYGYGSMPADTFQISRLSELPGAIS